ncbi:hypothetical protein EHM92_04880, partial [bacterium]
MRRLWKQIFDNSILLLAGRVIAKVATIAVMVGAARILGTEAFGAFSLMLALSSISGLVSDFGLVLPTIRSISVQTGDAARLVGNTVPARAVWGAGGVVGIVVAGIVLQLDWLPVVLFALSSVLDTSSLALIRSFEGKQEMRTVTLFIVAERFTFCAVVLAGLWWSRSLEGVAISYLLSYTITFLIALWMFQRRFGPVKVAIGPRSFSEHTKLGLPFVLSAVSSVLYYKADTLLLNVFRTNTDVGLYNAALRIIDAQ